MPHYAEFGTNTFVGSPAQAEAWASSPTAQGFFAVIAWFDFEEGGGGIFEIRLHVLEGVKEVLRRGRTRRTARHFAARSHARSV